MRKILGALSLASFAWIVGNASRQAESPQTRLFRLDSMHGLETVNTKADIVPYRGRKALHLATTPNQKIDEGSMLALVNGLEFKDGIIEVEVVGIPITAIDPSGRGFAGVVFRTHEHGASAENIYLRPTNGRADDQLRRNHAVQYESIPDFPWDRLRREQPGVYESYTDLEVGAWTKMKIEAAGRSARLYVNGATQPCLIVNDLKLGETRGQVGLWAHIATNAYFSNLKITQTN